MNTIVIKTMHLAFIFLINLCTMCEIKATHFWKKIEKENLKSIPLAAIAERPEITTYTQYLEWSIENQINVSAFDKRRILFSMLEEYEKEYPHQSEQVLDITSCQDLNILCGPQSSVQKNLISQIDRTCTEFGKVMLCGMVADPICNKQQLLDRQAIIKQLIEDQDLFYQCDSVLKRLKQSENLLFSFWQDDSFKQFAKMKMIHLPWDLWIIKRLNKNVSLAEIRERLSQFSECILLGSSAAGALLLPAAAIMLMIKKDETAQLIKKFAVEYMQVTSIMSFFSVLGAASWLFKQVIRNNTTEGMSEITAGMNYGSSVYYSWDGLRANLIGLKAIQSKLMAIAEYVRALHEFEELINSSHLLREKFEEFSLITNVLHDLPSECTDFKKLLHILATSTFTGQPSGFSNAGRILTAYQLMIEHKDRFIPGFVAIGMLDAYMSIARLIKESETRSNRWCFANYMNADADPHPYISIDNFWNPFLDPVTSIANSICMHCDMNPRTLIITGPNAGGKSTIIKAIALSLILAQSLGIAPAHHLSFSIFSKLMTYLNITDDIAAGNSHFKAGVLRAQELMIMAQGLDEKAYGFVAVDELFNGTTYKEGQAAAYSLIELLGRNERILCTTVTHFPLLTQLDKHAHLFKNFKVSVEYDDQHRILYPFKLEPGISEQHIAIDILSEQGFGGEFLEHAHAILQETKDRWTIHGDLHTS